MATPGTMLRTTWGQVDATSLSAFSRELTDNITANQVILWMLGQMGGIVSKQGKTIVESIMIDDAASAKWYSGYDPLDMTRTDAATSVEFAWKQLAATQTISGIERFQNGGANGMIDLWNALGQQVSITMNKKVNAAICADGSADGGKALIGLQSAIPFDPQTGTYGTLDSALNPNWRNQFFISGGTIDTSGTAAGAGNFAQTGTTGSDLIFAALRGLIVACTAGGDSPDLVLMARALYLKMLEGLEAKQQLTRSASATDEQMAQAGFNNILYMGVPITWDADMQPNSSVANGSVSNTAGFGAVCLNLDYMKMVFGEGYQFTFSDPISPDNQDSTSVKCLMYGNLIFNNRRRHGRANFGNS